jgi:hypothetical protein
MTRVLFWNVENFNLATIHDPTNATTTAHSAERNAIIRRIIQQPAPFGGAPPAAETPDLILIAECSSRNREVGSEGVPIAAAGVMRLLGEIRAVTANNQWCLVPPVRLGQYGFQEGVAAFYNAANLQFAGPYVWGLDYRTIGHTDPIARACPLADSVRPATARPALPTGPQLYSAAWANCLPNRVLGAGVAVLGGQNEMRLAGKWEHYSAGAAPTRLEFPQYFSRSPYLTHFIDLTAGAANRVLQIYTVHTSPSVAKNSTKKIADIPEIAAAQAAGTVTLVIGDFNVDTFEGAAEAYTPLLNLGFGILFDPRTPGTANVDPARRPYLTTHLLPVNRATGFNGPALDVTHNPAPRLGYMGSMGGARFATPTVSGAIDNALVRYPGGVAAPASAATVLNPVVGAPYPAALGMPVGTITKAPMLTNAVGAGHADPTLNQPGQFQQWNNFGKIHSTSDHLAISVVI